MSTQMAKEPRGGSLTAAMWPSTLDSDPHPPPLGTSAQMAAFVAALVSSRRLRDFELNAWRGV
jgi:hypothetical protein